MPKLKPLDIFRPGSFVDMDGNERTFTDQDLVNMAEAYDPQLSEAPLVVGHPDGAAPAYGWTKSLSVGEGSHLFADSHQVDADFAEMVGSGRFKKKSASFHLPDSPANPVPGVFYLRHIGFLGAQPPAVKGLRDAELVTADHASSDAFITIDFSEPEPDMLTKEELAKREKEIEQREASFSEKESGHSKKEAELKAREQQLADKEASGHLKDISSFAEELTDSGRLLPRDKDGLIAFMASIHPEATIEFAEGDATRKPATGEWLRTFLKELPVQVDYTERSAKENADKTTVSFASPDGYTVDPKRAELHSKAVSYQAEHKCDYVTAITAVGG